MRPGRYSQKTTSWGRLVRRGSAASALALGMLHGVSTARAKDGAYGRLDGDVAVTGELAIVAGEDGAALGLRAAGSYLTMAGMYVEYDEGLHSPGQRLGRRFSSGVEVRPLFLARFVNDLEQGPALVDLWLDSIGLSVGTFIAWQPPTECPTGCQSDGLEVSVGMALPLLSRANGPFIALRGGARFVLNAPSATVADETLPFAALSFGFERLAETGLLARTP